MDAAINQLLSSEQQLRAELRQAEEHTKTLQQERSTLHLLTILTPHLHLKWRYCFICSESLAADISQEEIEFTSKKSETEQKLEVLSRDLEGVASETEKLTEAKKKLKRGMCMCVCVRQWWI